MGEMRLSAPEPAEMEHGLGGAQPCHVSHLVVL